MILNHFLDSPSKIRFHFYLENVKLEILLYLQTFRRYEGQHEIGQHKSVYNCILESTNMSLKVNVSLLMFCSFYCVCDHCNVWGDDIYYCCLKNSFR